MTKEQVKVFEQLLNEKGFKGKNMLKHLLWVNTTPNKFEVGECFIVSDPGHKVYGYPVKNFKAKIASITAQGITAINMGYPEEWRYELHMEVECGQAKTQSRMWLTESQLSRCQRCKDNLNILGAPQSKYSESHEM